MTSNPIFLNQSTKSPFPPGPKSHFRNYKEPQRPQQQQQQTTQSQPIHQSFYFKPRRERLNWRFLASLQIDKVIREVDVELLQEVLENITYCDLEAEDLRYVDPNIVKLFQLSQLIVEYLLHSQEFLVSQRSNSTKELHGYKIKFDEMKNLTEMQDAQIKELKKEGKGLKKTLNVYQLMSRLPNFGTSSNGATQVPMSTHNRCSYCPKVFSSSQFLNSHLDRRHQGMPKHRQHMDEPDEKSRFYPNLIEKIGETVEKFSTKLVDTERQLRLDMELKMEKEILQRQELLERTYKMEQLRYEKEIQDLKTNMHVELDREKANINDASSNLKDLITKNLLKTSNVGKLEDDSSFSEETKSKRILEDIAKEKQRMEEMERKELEKMEKAKKEMQELQEAAIKSARDQFSKELSDMKKSFEEAKEMDKTNLNRKIDEASIQMKDLKAAFYKQKYEEEKMKFDQFNKPELFVRSPSPESVVKKPFLVPTDNNSNEYLNRLLSPTLNRSLSPTRSISPPVKGQYEQEMIQSISKPPPGSTIFSNAPATTKKGLTWPIALQLLAKHTNTPFPGCPWIKTYLVHSMEKHATQKRILEKNLSTELLKLGVNIEGFPPNWSENQQSALTAATFSLGKVVLDKKEKTPLYNQMYASIEQQVNSVSTAFHQFKPIPPPIITNFFKTEPRQPEIRKNNFHKPMASPPRDKSPIGRFKSIFLKKKSHSRNSSYSENTDRTSQYTASDYTGSPDSARSPENQDRLVDIDSPTRVSYDNQSYVRSFNSSRSNSPTRKKGISKKVLGVFGLSGSESSLTKSPEKKWSIFGRNKSRSEELPLFSKQQGNDITPRKLETKELSSRLSKSRDSVNSRKSTSKENVKFVDEIQSTKVSSTEDIRKVKVGSKGDLGKSKTFLKKNPKEDITKPEDKKVVVSIMKRPLISVNDEKSKSEVSETDESSYSSSDQSSPAPTTKKPLPELPNPSLQPVDSSKNGNSQPLSIRNFIDVLAEGQTPRSFNNEKAEEPAKSDVSTVPPNVQKPTLKSVQQQIIQPQVKSVQSQQPIQQQQKKFSILMNNNNLNTSKNLPTGTIVDEDESSNEEGSSSFEDSSPPRHNPISNKQQFIQHQQPRRLSVVPQQTPIKTTMIAQPTLNKQPSSPLRQQTNFSQKENPNSASTEDSNSFDVSEDSWGNDDKEVKKTAPVASFGQTANGGGKLQRANSSNLSELLEQFSDVSDLSIQEVKKKGSSDFDDSDLEEFDI